MPIQAETELYPPIKAFFESMGYEVKGEVQHCDIVAVRGEEKPIVVELKKSLNLPLLIQGMQRLRVSDKVYLGVEHNRKGRGPHGIRWSELTRLCQMLGLGLITVTFFKTKKPRVDIQCDPTPYSPRKNKSRAFRLMHEFHERSGDYNVGGSTRKKLVTAYRERALLTARMLKEHGPLSTKELRERTGNPKVTSLLQNNYYHWFQRVSRGVYELTPLGIQELQDYEYIPLDASPD